MTLLNLKKIAFLFAVLVANIYSLSIRAQSMTDLGTLGGTFSKAYGISSDGSVIVGYSLTSGSAYHAFKYTGSTMTDLGTLGGNRSVANGISSDGTVIVGESRYTILNTNRHAFKYTGTTMTDLGTLGGTNSVATSVSSNGSVIVGYSDTVSGASHAFKYAGTTMTDLGTLGGTSSSAYGVSSDGSVIVGYSNTTGDVANRAFKYTGTTMTDLGTLGGAGSSAYGISSDGTVIVGSSDTTGNATYHAFKYTGSTMTDLGTLGGGTSAAYAVSANGSVIVGYSDTASGASHAFKYTGTTMTDLGTLGGASSTATAVSSDGSVIVGYSDTSGGSTHAFVYKNSLVDVQNTYSALAISGYQLNGLLNAQNTALTVNLNSDCVVFGANNVCVAVGGRYTNVSSPTTAQATGNIQLGYRFDPTIRAGVFLDQGISNATPNNYTIKNSQPLAGLFAVYAPSGNTLGPQVKASGAYSNNGVNITRNTLANTEAGQGASSLVSQGAQLEVAYGFAVTDSWQASPVLGIRATKVTRNAYAETIGATFPITYNTINQSATTSYAGAKAFGYVLPNVSVGVSAGVEQDISSNMDNYSGSIYYLGDFSINAPAVRHTRAYVGANADYWIEKNQRVSLGLNYNQQSLNTANGITAMLSYTIGL